MTRIVSLLFHDLYERDPAESGFPGALADAYKLTITDFEAIVAEVAGSCGAPPVLGLARPAGAREVFAVTVDDGGVSYYTHLADRIEAAGWRGHAFVATDMIGTPGFLTPAQIRELDGRGHLMGSHSKTHPVRFSMLPWAEMVEEWTASKSTLEDIVGHAITVASLPRGYYSPTVARSAAEAGLELLFTSEPETEVRERHGCAVVGRFTVRPGHTPTHIRSLVQFDGAALWKEWGVWNAKKTLKNVLGPGYPQLGAWIAAMRSGRRVSARTAGI